MPTIDDYKNFLADLCKRTGIKALESDDTGLVSVRVQDEYNVNFQFLKHLAVDPQTRVPWQLTVQPNGDLVYSTSKNLRGADRTRLLAFCQQGGGTVAARPRGGVTVTVPAARRAAFFAALRERNVIDEKHAGELPARVVREQERVRLDMLERARRAAQADG